MLLSNHATTFRLFAAAALRCRPGQTSDPSAHHRSLSLTHVVSLESYENMTPFVQLRIGQSPWTAMDVTVASGDESRIGLMDTGAKLAHCVLTFLYSGGQKSIIKIGDASGTMNTTSQKR